MTEPEAAVPGGGVEIAHDTPIEAPTELEEVTQGAAMNAELIPLHPNVLTALEKGDEVIRVYQYGTSLWSDTKRIDVQMTDGSTRSYFLKHSPEAPWVRALRPGEGYFFLCDYLDIIHDLPDAADLGKKLAAFHRSSKFPNGKFGFHCTTFDGKNPLNTSWDSSWTSYFQRLMHDIYELEKAANGYWKEFDDVIQITLDRLIPRLLDALVAEGRTIKPTLIHGDLWESNIGTDRATGEIFVYDACAYYAHHEKEVGIWRCAHHRMADERYRREYFKHYPPSEPRREADDRNRLYAAQTMIVTSLDFPDRGMRGLIMADLNYLIDKYVLRGEE
ncbi:vegetative incompatibility protein 4 [Apiospora hydei]|uniref:protein-ribulosamine 3-kinase n=1 Tax=Apiospora hydei TaxID=1337664 RepID=A0ABR1UVG1_9PEZI